MAELQGGMAEVAAQEGTSLIEWRQVLHLPVALLKFVLAAEAAEAAVITNLDEMVENGMAEAVALAYSIKRL